MLKNIIFLFLMLLSSLGFTAGRGGGDISGGGFGIVLDGKIRLLDLAENGIPNETNAGLQKSPVFLKPIYQLSWASENTKNHLSVILEKIFEEDPVLASATIQALQSLSWAITELPLKPLDRLDTPLDIHLVQIAVRKPTQVYIFKKYWDQMSTQDQAALLLHEALSALAEPSLPEIRVRQLVSSFFKVDSTKNSMSAIYHAVSDSFPTLHTTFRKAPELAFNNDETHTIETHPPIPPIVLIKDFDIFPRWNFKPALSVHLPKEPKLIETWQPSLFPYYSKLKSDQIYYDGYIVPGREKSNTTSICTDSKTAIQRISFYSYRIQVSFPKLMDQNLPRLQWQLLPVLDNSLEFKNGLCTEQQKSELQWILNRFTSPRSVFPMFSLLQAILDQ